MYTVLALVLATIVAWGITAQKSDLTPILVIGGVMFMCAPVLGIVVKECGVRPKEITNDKIILVDVHKEFADAVEEELGSPRHRRDDDAEVLLPRRRRRRWSRPDDSDE